VTRHVAFRAWEGAEDFVQGTHQGTGPAGGELRYVGPVGLRDYTDPYGDGRSVLYEWAAWISPQVSPGFGATSLIPSWNASTPEGSWLELEVRFSLQGTTMSPWYVLGRWAETDHDIHPTSVPGRDDDLASVSIDVLDLKGDATLTTYQLRVVLMRLPGSAATPSVRLLGCMASAVPAEPPAEVSAGGVARGRELAVPTYSQQLHRGEYPQWDSGGESWCSPTSTSMLLASWGTGPTPEEYAWVEPRLVDRFVPHAARSVFDYNYAGAGNWSFNVAYAARFGTAAFVTRLRSLAEAELFVAAGIPLVATVSFAEDQLDGANYGTEGHLLTIIGFDQHGNVISNDPASHRIPRNDEVRTVYDRAQFERAWLGSAGGVVYVIHPAGVPLPPRPAEANW
jgi:hypothetical protein